MVVDACAVFAAADCVPLPLLWSRPLLPFLVVAVAVVVPFFCTLAAPDRGRRRTVALSVVAASAVFAAADCVPLLLSWSC